MSAFEKQPLEIRDLILIKGRRFSDPRGWFMETYSTPAFAELGISSIFIQDNNSLSVPQGTIRGLHFQKPPHAQAKLVRVSRGSIFDIAVDLRKGSPTYGRWCGETLTAQGAEQLFIPRGFAHGFCTLEPETEVVYKVDDVYFPSCDTGLFWADPDIDINWPVSPGRATVSDKDSALPRFAGFNSPFDSVD